MIITIKDRGAALRDRLHDRLERATQLRCPEHGEPPVAVIINGRENGWFDTCWTTCCEALERQAVTVVSNRC